MKFYFAQRSKRIKPNAIREIFKVAKLPKVISFAGGLPSPKAFPEKIIKKIVNQVLKEEGEQALQYGLSEGIPELRKELIKLQNQLDGLKYNLNNILITCGAQEIMDLLAKILIDPGDAILVENPTFLGALQSFEAYQPDYVTAETDNQGVIPEKVEAVLKKKKIKLIYLIPNFQNPTGKTISLERREKLAFLAQKYQVPLLEDDPYRLVRFQGKDLPSIASFDQKKYVLYAGSFSKILAPGFRLGWISGHSEMIKKLVLAKQGVNLHTSPFIQWIAYYYLKQNHLEHHLQKIKKIYAQKAKLMGKLLDQHLGQIFKFTHPQGGLFIWGESSKNFDLTALYKKAAQKYKVAYVPGEHFFARGTRKKKNTLRLNFSYSSKNQIRTGIKRLAKLFKNK
jgi:2-aminoadipate transaminase